MRSRGNYALLFSVLVFVLLGFGALAVDVQLVRHLEEETQVAADATSVSTLIELNRTRDLALAQVVADKTVNANPVLSAPGVLSVLEFGDYEPASRVFTPTGLPTASAVRAEVMRGNLPFVLSSIWGFEEFATRRSAVASNGVHAVMIMVDGTIPLFDRDFTPIRNHLLELFDVMAQRPSAIWAGLSQYTAHYVWEHSTPKSMIDHFMNSARSAEWEAITPGSRAGEIALRLENTAMIPYCANNSASGAFLSTSTAKDPATLGDDDFTNPQLGGCYPLNFRIYSDEDEGPGGPGSPENGLQNFQMALRFAKARFAGLPSVVDTQTIIFMTHGWPRDGSASVDLTGGGERTADGFVESRWEYFYGQGLRTDTKYYARDLRGIDAATFERETMEEARATFAQDGTNIWVMSYYGDNYGVKGPDRWTQTLPQGQGEFLSVAGTPDRRIRLHEYLKQQHGSGVRLSL
ncbi:MAG: Tad domain-containing protein [Myxococcota bacterium]